MSRPALLLLAALSLPLIAVLRADEPTVPAAAPERRPNVLFLVVDDLRPQLGCYGQAQMHTPSIDSLAERGVLFERSFCMVPTCGASRAAVMTGLRPTPKRFRTYRSMAAQDTPDAPALNGWFQQHGYTTLSVGKVFHMIGDHAEEWSEPPFRSKRSDYQDVEAHQRALDEFPERYPEKGAKARGLPYEGFDAPDAAYRDGEHTERALAHLERLAADPSQPFFLAVGFQKPHLPFCAPKRYWDLYDRKEIQLPWNSTLPVDVPIGATLNSGELRAYSGVPSEGPIDVELARTLIHGYYACVSFIDAQVGRLLQALDELELSDDTIVVLWGDHGYQLGDHGMWNKHCCFETSMHAPLIIAAPGAEGVRPGTRPDALVEFTTIFPTLCELAGLPAPAGLDGSSALPLMRDPSLAGPSFAIGRYGTGDTLRTDRYRYTEYREKAGEGELTGRMLFDLDADPEERRNLLAPELAEELRPRPELVDALSSGLSQHKGREPGSSKR